MSDSRDIDISEWEGLIKTDLQSTGNGMIVKETDSLSIDNTDAGII